jgi:antitoxin (DNA-binding transcriptional repressor) of toxin-antitoxin stability system
MEATKVGIREFRTDLAEYIASSTPVAITRHGHTVGYFIPTQGQVDADITALKKASKALDRMLAAHSVNVEEVVAEFKVARKRSSVGKTTQAKAKVA